MDTFRGRKIRVIGRVSRPRERRQSDSVDVVSSSSVLVSKPNGEDSEFALVSFGEQLCGNRDSHKLDYCYKDSEGTELIFVKEVKPLICGVVDGRDVTVIAYGARGSGKTHLIQGWEEEIGLAVLAMEEFLRTAEESGKSITVSLYDVYQDQVHDLLDPRNPIIPVFEDAQGKIQFKGLTQMKIKTISEFESIFSAVKNLYNPLQKGSGEILQRSHKGLVINVSSNCGNSVSSGKMNFVDLAGYEDIRRQSTGSRINVETSRINKSIHALQNVMYALSGNEGHVPYRESKITHILKDSLRGTNKILVITCLRPGLCQDSFYMLSLASRICQPNIRETPKTAMKINYKNRDKSSLQKRPTPQSASASKGRHGSYLKFTERKTRVNLMASAAKGRRKLFDEAGQSRKLEMESKKQEGARPDLAIEATHEMSVGSVLLSQETSQLKTLELEATAGEVKESSQMTTLNLEATDGEVKERESIDLALEDTCIKSFFSVPLSQEASRLTTMEEIKECTSSDIARETCMDVVNEEHNMDKGSEESPPLSVRLQEITNNLKFLYSSAPSSVNVLRESDALASCKEETETDSTRTVTLEYRTPDRCITSNISQNPWQTFSARSSNVKNSLVDEYLRFMNTAAKEELKKLKGIGDKRASRIIDLREHSPEPFHNLEDLKSIGLSMKQIKGLMTKEFEELLNID